MKKFALLALFLAPACAIPGDSAWSDLHANGFVGMYDLGVSGDVHDLSFTNGPVNINGDLTINEASDTNFLYGVRVGFAPIEVSVSGFEHKSVHGGTFTGDFDLGGATVFSGATDAQTTMDFEMQKIMLGFDFLNTGLFRIGLLVGVDLFTFNDFSVLTTDGISTLNYAIATDEDAPIPTVGVRSDLLLPEGFRIGGEISGVAADVDDIDVTFLDMDFQAAWHPMDNEWIEILLGYRRMSFEFDGELDGTSLDAEIDFDGFYWGVGITF